MRCFFINILSNCHGAKIATLSNGERTCVDDGRYFVAWRKVDGAWRIYRDMFNRNTPVQQ